MRPHLLSWAILFCASHKAHVTAQIALYEHVVDEHDVAFVLKTDDDSFVNVPAMLADLRARCSSADCTVVKLYMGFQVLSTLCLRLHIEFLSIGGLCILTATCAFGVGSNFMFLREGFGFRLTPACEPAWHKLNLLMINAILHRSTTRWSRGSGRTIRTTAQSSLRTRA